MARNAGPMSGIGFTLRSDQPILKEVLLEQNMQIANRKIGPNEKPLVIAELGINHGGDVEVAKYMVQLAAKSGCECIKHQTHFVED